MTDNAIFFLYPSQQVMRKWQFTANKNTLLWDSALQYTRHSSLTPIYLYRHRMTFGVVNAITSYPHNGISCSRKQISLNNVIRYDALDVHRVSRKELCSVEHLCHLSLLLIYIFHSVSLPVSVSISIEFAFILVHCKFTLPWGLTQVYCPGIKKPVWLKDVAYHHQEF